MSTPSQAASTEPARWPVYIHALVNIHPAYPPMELPELPTQRRLHIENPEYLNARRQQPHSKAIKDVELLNHICRVLTTKGGDVTATAFRLDARKSKLYLLYSKNTKASEIFENYAHTLIGELASNAANTQVVATVFQYCSAKIRSKLFKIGLEFGLREDKERRSGENLWQYSDSNKVHHKLKQELNRIGYLERSGVDVVELLDSFTWNCYKNKSLTLEEVVGQILLSATLSKSINLEEFITARQASLITKVGDYVRAIKMIKARFGDLKKTLPELDIVLQEIPCPDAERKKVFRSTLAALNKRASDTKVDNLRSFEEIKLIYPNALEESDGSLPSDSPDCVERNFSQHAEITLALYLLQDKHIRKINGNYICLGVSKSCCFWCQEFIKLLNASSKPKILYKGAHGRMYDGWMLPNNAEQSLRDEMERVIEHEIDQVIGAVRDRSRSDTMSIDTELAESEPEPDDSYSGVKIRVERNPTRPGGME